MKLINEKIVLEFYLDEIENDSILFLKDNVLEKNKIRKEIISLKNAIMIHEKIEIAIKLWKYLFSAAMTYIDKDKRGFDQIFKYFDEFVKFEELIFASDSFYRDHTLHSLWVYFLSEYYMKHPYFVAKQKAEEQGKTYLKTLVNIYKDLEIDKISSVLNQFVDNDKNNDSIRCIISLTHDLGYPIKKIAKINQSIKKILPFFSIHQFNEFHFNYSEEHDNFIKQFLNMLCIDFRILFTSENEKRIAEIIQKLSQDIDPSIHSNMFFDILQKRIKALDEHELKILKDTSEIKVNILKDEAMYNRFSIDFEQYEHGIMSAYLLIKLLPAFKNTKFVYTTYSDINYNEIDIIDFESKLNILKAIANHTSKSYQITDFESFSDVLIFIDEIEEFSRISRANQNRQFINEFCKTNVSFENETFNIQFVFDNETIEHLNPELAFINKCKRLLHLFNIPKLSEDLKLKFEIIGNIPQNQNHYTLEIRKHFANIMINEEEQNIPDYLKSNEFYTKEEYMHN